MSRRQFFVACSLAMLFASPAAAREWSDASGKFKIQAELADSAGGSVRLKKPTGEIAVIQLAKLSPADQDFVKQALARSTAATTVLKKHCYVCHGEGGSDEGGMNFILNGARLAEKGQVTASEPDKSLLIKRIVAGKMPPEDIAERPSKEEIEILRDWITQGAFSPSGTASREFITNDHVMEAIAADIATADERSRIFYRYFNITHLYNAGLADEELQTMRLALSKLLNSLSWDRKILTPKPVDAAQTVFRIDVRDLRWTRELWEALALVYPYNIQFSGKSASECYRLSATRTPVLRADWFVAHASSGPLYHALLQMPGTLQGLQQQLKISFAQNLRQDRANRAGFANSGISVHPRVIERHEITDGACWVSYDFGASAGNRNFFNNPLAFDYDGGEVIFSLPNGLQAYMIVNREGQRLDKAPTKIVRDLKSSDATVVNGISCMRCHAGGIIPKHDEVRKHAQTNSKIFGAEKLKTILAIYPEHDVLDKQIKEDQARFKEAMDKIGITRLSAEGEPIYNMAQRHADPIDLRMAAAEVGKTPEEFRAALDKLVSLQRVVGPLRVGSTIPRDVFEESFGTVVTFLSVGRHLPPGARIAEAREAAGADTPEPDLPEPVEPATTVEDPLGTVGDVRGGLVHHWKFDETKGDSARDSIGKLTATLTGYGSSDKRFAKGRTGNAIAFSKPEHAAFLSQDINFPQMTLAMWINVQGESGLNPRVLYPWLLFVFEENKGLGVVHQLIEPSKPKFKTWIHYAVAIDQDTKTATIYKNAKEVASGRIQSRDGKVWSFGHSADAKSHRDSLLGLMDDVRVYNRLLRPAEVGKLAGVRSDAAAAEEIGANPAETPAPDEPAITIEDPLGASGDVRSGLVHQWKFDETKGDVARDVVGKNNASLVNFTKDEERFVKGKLGNALSFSRAEQVAYPAKDIDFPQLSIAFWLNVQLEKGTNPRIASPWITLNFEHRNGVGLFGQVFEPGKPEPGEWNHYVVTIDRVKKNAVVFRNGDEVASGKITKDRDPTRWAFGHNVDTGNHGDSLNGMLDDMRVYRRLLTAEEAAKLVKFGAKEEVP